MMTTHQLMLFVVMTLMMMTTVVHSMGNVTCYECDDSAIEGSCATPSDSTKTCPGFSCFKIKSVLDGGKPQYMRGCNRWNLDSVCVASYGKTAYDPSSDSTGFTCYCNNVDKCNHAPPTIASPIYYMLWIIPTIIARWFIH